MKLSALAVVPFALSVLASPCVAQTVLTGSSYLPAGILPVGPGIVQWGQDVEKATAGRVKMNLLPKAVSNPQGSLDAVRDGLADVSWTVHGLTPARFVLTKVAEFPMLGDKGEQTSVAYQRIHERHLEKAGEHKGVKVLAVFTHSAGQVFNNLRPVRTINDLVGLKMRTAGGVILDAAKVLGVVPVLRPAPEIYELVSTGVVDGVFVNLMGITGFKIERNIKHATIVPGGLYNTSFVLFMNEERYNKMSKADQEAIASVSGEHVARRIGRAFDQQDVGGLDALRTNKAEVLTAPADFVQALAAKVAPVEAAWVKEASARGIDGAKVLAEFRAEVRKVTIQ